MNDIQPLTNLQCGQTARVGKLTIQGSMRRRLLDIALHRGAPDNVTAVLIQC